MTTPFSSQYSDAYDLLYGEKNYTAECDLIERLFRDYSQGAVETVLDLGCGTGNHSLELARRGYHVVGVDRSEAMLDRARSKVEEGAGSVAFARADVRELDLPQQFDAALMMFAVLSYQVENEDLLAALRATRRHLRQGALLLFDCWYGPAVLSQGPSQRTKIIEAGGERVVRLSSGQLDTARGTCAVDYKLLRLRDDRLVSETNENHLVRYLFKPELDLLLSVTGFESLRLGQFPEFDLEPDSESWNVLGVARAT